MWTEADFKVVNFQPPTQKQLSLLSKLEPLADHSKMSFEEAKQLIEIILDAQKAKNLARSIRSKKSRRSVDWDGIEQGCEYMPGFGW